MPEQKPTLEYERPVGRHWSYWVGAVAIILVVVTLLLVAGYFAVAVIFFPG